jgi:hypothetical protein
LCGEKLKPGNNVFSASRGGVVCGKHNFDAKSSDLKISDSCVKILRLAGEMDLNNLARIKMEGVKSEMGAIVNCFAGFCG